MKKQSLGRIIVLTSGILVQLGCSLNSAPKHKLTYADAQQFKNAAEHFQQAGQLDSALANHFKCLAIFRSMEPGVDTVNDSKFIRALSITEGQIAVIYSQKMDSKNSILYATEALKWTKMINFPEARLDDEDILALNLMRTGDAQKEGSEEQKNTYKEAEKYIVLLGPDIDSLCERDNFTSTPLTISCKLAAILYKKIGDTSRASFYKEKYRIRYTRQNGGNEPAEF